MLNKDYVKLFKVYHKEAALIEYRLNRIEDPLKKVPDYVIAATAKLLETFEANEKDLDEPTKDRKWNSIYGRLLIEFPKVPNLRKENAVF